MTTRPCRTCQQPFRVVGKARYCSWDCRHGTDAGYNAGCSCERCRAAHARAHKRSRIKPRPLVPSVGSQRRIRALARLGWSSREISRRMGRERSFVQKVMGRATLEQATVDAITRLYDELSMTWCTSPAAARVAADARAKGWPPPLAWDDEDLDDPDGQPYTEEPADDMDPVVVERILAGSWHLPATAAERTEVIRRWALAGRSLSELGRLTGWKPERYYRLSDGEAA
ncbi:MAG: hypothetical protein EPO65_00450 [Dehalococcoidia bacterium]|nr:MAG: hypothetical protein EPO65_00450 [Dehalococcoidia bacterium]